MTESKLLGDNNYLKDKIERAETLKKEKSMLSEIDEALKA
jgi:hypothetical protein